MTGREFCIRDLNQEGKEEETRVHHYGYYFVQNGRDRGDDGKSAKRMEVEKGHVDHLECTIERKIDQQVTT